MPWPRSRRPRAGTRRRARSRTACPSRDGSATAVDEQDRRAVRGCPTRVRAAAGRRRPSPCGFHRSSSSRCVVASRSRGSRGPGHRTAHLHPGRRSAYLSTAACLRTASRRRGGAILTGCGPARAPCSWDASASSGSSSARSPRPGREAVRPSSSPETPASARPGSPPSWRSRPRGGVRGPRRTLDRSRRYGAAVPTVRRGPATARGASAGRPAAASSQLGRVRGNARPARGTRGRGAGAARPRGPALGGRVDARPRRLPRAQPRRRTGPAAGRPTARTSSRRPRGCAGSPTASCARARASLRARAAGARGVGGVSRGSDGRSPARPDRRHHRPLGGQPLLRGGASRRRRRADR